MGWGTGFSNGLARKARLHRPGTHSEAGLAAQPAGADPRDEIEAPDKPVEAVRYATVDVGSIPTVSITENRVRPLATLDAHLR